VETLKKRAAEFDGCSSTGNGRRTESKGKSIMRIRIRPTLVALPVALLLALTACSGDDGSSGDGSNDDIASADDGNGDDGAGDNGTSDNRTPGDDDSEEPLSEEEFHNQLLEYAQCLRDQGIDVEDPAPGEGIAIQNEGDPGESDAALEACEDVAPGAPPGGERDEDEVRQQMLDYAQCMRDNGVESFEDPKPGEGTHLGPDQANDPDFEEAEEVCNEQIMGGQPDTQEQGA
jgi:hypothetical protein